MIMWECNFQSFDSPYFIPHTGGFDPCDFDPDCDIYVGF